MTLDRPSPALDDASSPDGHRRADARRRRPPARGADVWRRFARNKLAMVGLVVIVILVLAAIFAPLITPYSYSPTSVAGDFRQARLASTGSAPTRRPRHVHPGRLRRPAVAEDRHPRHGASRLIIGVLFGAVAGFFGGFADTVIMRITDIFLAIPYIVLAVAIASCSGAARTR